MTAFAKITRKGQITIPADIRVALQVGPGDLLAWEVAAGGVAQVRRLRSLEVAFPHALESVADENQSAAGGGAHSEV